MFAWWHKKPDTAVAGGDAPKYNAAAATLPSANQNPNNSLAGIARPPATNPAAALGSANAAGFNSNVANPAGYPAYPVTPYSQARVSPVATGPQTAGMASATNAPPGVAYGAPSAASGAGVYPANGVAAAPPGVGQPQSGFYNPTYDGGAAANRYASGAAIPGMQPAMPNAAPAMSAMPNSSMPNYRVADARSGMGSAPMTSAPSGVAPPNAAVTAPAAANPPSDDRYSAAGNTMNGAASPFPPSADRYAGPASAAPAASSSFAPGAGDRYSQPTGDYRSAPSYDVNATGSQPATTTNPVGNTGYNPPNVYAPPTATPGAAVPSNSDYRPGGTGNYISPSGAPYQPNTSSTSPENHAQSGGVVPAVYQSAANASPSSSGVELASTSPMSSPSSEVYGAYQGTNSSSSTNEPAYSSPRPTGAAPALLPAHAAW
jgi:hypothetical protein